MKPYSDARVCHACHVCHTKVHTAGHVQCWITSIFVHSTLWGLLASHSINCQQFEKHCVS